MMYVNTKVMHVYWISGHEYQHVANQVFKSRTHRQCCFLCSRTCPVDRKKPGKA